MSKKRNNLLIAASGTGGHIFPALAVSKKVEKDWDNYWLGVTKRLDSKFVPRKYNLLTLNLETPKKNIFRVFQYLRILFSILNIIKIFFLGVSSFNVKRLYFLGTNLESSLC